jgi:hypothetical protein
VLGQAIRNVGCRSTYIPDLHSLGVCSSPRQISLFSDVMSEIQTIVLASVKKIA